MSDAHLPMAPRWVDVASRVIRRLPAGRYRAMNWVVRRRQAPFWARMPDDLGGLQFRCDLRDPLMREVCMTGRYEPQETALLRRLLAPAMTFADVGANWGYFTLLAAHLVSLSGRVVSVEADPRAQRALAVNLARNNLQWVAVFGAAASDEPGSLSCAAYGSDSEDIANLGVMMDTQAREGGRRFTVPARTLDAMLDEAGVERVDVLKMDIEGAEQRALAGLSRRLSAGLVDRIVLELHPSYLRREGGSAVAVIEGLARLGYRGWQITHSPRAHRLAARSRVDLTALLEPLSGGALGPWPHLLWARDGLEAVPEAPP